MKVQTNLHGGIIPFTGEENGIGGNIEMNTDKNKELEFQKKTRSK